MTSARPPFAWGPVALVIGAQAAVLIAMAPFYGPHRDELYFASAGQRLAWGYPDQPSFTPLLARVSTEIAPQSLVVLRLWSLLAVAGIVLLAVQYARLLGGARAAQVLTALCVAAGGFVIAVGHRLSTATFDTLAWTALLVLVTQAVVDDRPRLWLAAGVVAGVGLNNKHAVAFLILALLIAVALDRETRPVLRTRWPWIAGACAGLLWVPNLVWQARHDWPVFELSADIAEEYGGVGGRLAMFGEAFAMFSPVIGILWIVGLVQLLRYEPWRRARLPALAFLIVVVTFVVSGGKGYYLAGAIVPLIAAGCTWLANRWGPRRLAFAGTGLVVSALVAWPALVPVLPAQTFADSFYTGLNDDQAETIGWPDYSAVVREVVVNQASGVVVFTGNYGQAGAFEWYDVGASVFSGHNGFQDWGPPPEDAGPVVVVGLSEPSRYFTDCTQVATLLGDVEIDNAEQGGPVWFCTGPRLGWGQAWDDLAHYDA